MIQCQKCGKENEDDALFCSKCGNSLKSTDAKPSFDRQVEGFAEEVGRIGKETGKRIEEAAQRFGKETQELGKRLDIASKKVSRNMESWYDRTFGVFGPLVSSFVVLIILRLVIVGLNAGAEETPVLANIGDFLLDYLLLIFLLAFFIPRFWCNYFCPIGAFGDLALKIENKIKDKV